MIDKMKLLADLDKYLNRPMFKNIRDYLENDIHAIVDKQPKVGEWMPCRSGQLPEDLQEVEITFLNHDPESYYASIKDVPQTGVAVYCKYTWYWYTPTTADILAEYQHAPHLELDDALEVIAWKPLDEPYREDGADE